MIKKLCINIAKVSFYSFFKNQRRSIFGSINNDIRGVTSMVKCGVNFSWYRSLPNTKTQFHKEFYYRID